MRAVDRIEDPAEMRDLLAAIAGAELLAEHMVIGKPFGDHRAEAALDLDVDLGDEIDHALLVDAEVLAEMRQLHLAGAHDRFDSRGKEQWLGNVRHRATAS